MLYKNITKKQLRINGLTRRAGETFNIEGSWNSAEIDRLVMQNKIIEVRVGSGEYEHHLSESFNKRR